MKYLYNKRGRRWGGGERNTFAFFAVGAFAALIVVFVIGLQVGRVIEKNAVSAEGRQGKGAAPAQASQGSPPRAEANDIGKKLGAFSEEAVKVPVVPPPDAKTTMGDVEKRLTFQETLARKEAGPVPLVAPAQKDDAAEQKKAEAGRKKYVVQAGSFREKGKAESFRKRLAKAGYSVRLAKGAGKNRERYFRVLVGPYAEREAARKAIEKLKGEMQVDARLLPG
ncbi:MAG: SPOR domain-containing protein [Deltaproteobacteria bacterium]|nr:SPOR domain-containing protein [Deltaproteobacteria bacterium]